MSVRVFDKGWFGIQTFSVFNEMAASDFDIVSTVLMYLVQLVENHPTQSPTDC